MEKGVITDAGCLATVHASDQLIPRVWGQGFTGFSNLLLFELSVSLQHLVHSEVLVFFFLFIPVGR